MVTEEEVKKTAKLARLKLSEEEGKIYAAQLTDIMNLIDTLQEVDCSNVEPLSSVCNMPQRLRDDVATTTPEPQQLFANSPGKTAELAKELHYFIVPKVVE